MPPAPVDRRAVVAGAIVLLGFALVAVSLVGLVLLGRDDAAAFEVAARPAPPLELTDQDGQPFTLASLAGRPVLVFFGYTHCPDVCPESIGLIGQALAASPAGARAVFVSIDPERDDVAAMKAYLRYLPAAFTGLTGAPDEVRRNADAWSVRYAKEEAEPGSGAYGMSHTSDIFLVDGAGRLRASFPYGTPVEPIEAWLTRLLTAQPAPPDAGPPSAAPSSAAGSPRASAAAVAATSVPMSMGDLRATVVSTSVWAGGQSPVILSLADPMGMPLDGSAPVSVQVVGADGVPVGSDVAAVAVRPAGESQVSVRRHGRHPQPRVVAARRDRRGLDRAGDGRRARPGRLGAARWPGAGRRHADARRRRRQPAGDLDPAAVGRPALPVVDGRRPRRGPSLRDRDRLGPVQGVAGVRPRDLDGRATSSTAGPT